MEGNGHKESGQKENGMKEVAKMAKESSHGMMVRNTKDSGKQISGIFQEENYMLMAISTTESGRITKRMGMVSLAMQK